MKHILIALIVLSLTLVLCLLALSLLEDTTQLVVTSLHLAQQAAQQDDYSTACRCVLQAQAQWRKTEGLYGVLLNHSETDEITFLFSALIICAEQPVKEEFRYRCAELVAMLEHIAEMEKPYYYNIL
ncbi:MAG: DUF4363 family protein [Ruminococcaceae bacterium]|nr:DUF4363 family protein [Oscillospiraceae bacterium]